MTPFPQFFPNENPSQDNSLSNPVTIERNNQWIRQFLKGLAESCPSWAYFYAFHVVMRALKVIDQLELDKIENVNQPYYKGYELGNYLFAKVESEYPKK